jgi:hypothetical protein
MPQVTNLNVSPYFDDFEDNKNYKRVLFKPGTPIQSRELTTLQSILQDQIDKFGQHFFKEGAKVIPGQTSYDNRVDFVRLDPIYFGIDINQYVKNLVGTIILGQTSGIQAKVELAITDSESTVLSNTLYFRYANSSTTDFSTNKFIPGEILLVTEDITYGTGNVLKANSPFATVISEDATGKASIASINEGVYFLRGHFVKIIPQTIILDQYSIDANARVGLLVEEDIVTSYDDETLNDNAQGFSNYAAPGADRLKIAATFIKKDLDDFNDENFVELMRIVNGDLQTFTPSKTNDTYLRDTLAKRTFDESGNYVVRPFEVFVKENLNDGLGNNGIYFDDQTTPSGLEPSESTLTLEISPGKAYIEGYDIERNTTTLIDIDKPRTSRAVNNFSLSFKAGAAISVNNIYGNPRVGLTTSDVLQLCDSRINNASPTALPGNQIGVARIYDFYSSDSKYTGSSTEFKCSIYDIETYTGITISSNITLNAPAKIQGNNSKASGYLKANVTSSNSLTLYCTKGKFLPGETLVVNGISSSPTITSVRDYSFSDIKSIRTVDSGTSQVFVADLVLNNVKSLSPTATQYTITSGGTVTVGITTSSTIAPKVGDIITYTKAGNDYPTYNKVTSISSNLKSFTVVGISSVGVGLTALVDGTLPASTITVNNLVVVEPSVNNLLDRDLYEPLPASNISSLNLNNSKLDIRKTYIGNVTNNTFTVVESDPNLFFKSFNVNEYQISYTDGIVEKLQSGSVSITNGGKTLTINQLSKASSSNAKLIATLDKINLTAKKKNLVRCATLTINRSSKTSSGTGANTLNDGLTYSSIYGTRVQDEEICLNLPDIFAIQDIYESYDTNDPILPSLDVTEVIGDLTTLLPGQVVNGRSSGSKARIISVTSPTSFTFTYINDVTFIVNEELDFINSDVSAKVLTTNQFSKDISDRYSFDNGSRREYVDYGKIVRLPGQEPPARKITIVFDYYSTPSGDTGDFVAYPSFDPALYSTGIPEVYQGLRATDAIDIRPRVKDYNPSTATLSPFEFSSREFNTTGASVSNPIVSDSQLLLGYSYYLGRTDVLYLNKNGNFEIVTGAPSEALDKPISTTTALDIAVITMPPYVFSANQVYVSQVKHKRYTMKDIERLEQRISNVEKLTSLTLLEVNTKNLTIKDASTGLDRFKSGFFVDNFNDHSAHSIAHPDFKASIDSSNGVLRPSHYTTSIDLLYNNDVSVDGVNIRRNGKLVTLDYTEVSIVSQPFATRLENVNPFSIVTWTGTLSLSPASDTWFSEEKLTTLNVEQKGNYDAFINALGADPNTGFSPVDWGEWETTWSGKELIDNRLVSTDYSSITVPRAYQVVEKNAKGKNVKKNYPVTNDAARQNGKPINQSVKVNTDTYELEYKTKTQQSRTGIQYQVTESVDSVNLGNRIVKREIIPYMRARNIEFTAKRTKPSTQFYAFFNKIDVNKFVFPKLIEITMTSGTFLPGETVFGNIIGASKSDNLDKSIKFRLAAANHKYGDYLNPDETYEKNPYNLNQNLPAAYSSTSTILNIDTNSLQEQSESSFYGYIIKGMKLKGQTSNAVATVTDVRLISDDAGTLIGSFFIPDPKVNSNPKFETGAKTLLLISDRDNEFIPGEVISQVESIFSASGELNYTQETILSTKNAEVQRIPASDTKIIEGTVIEVKEITKSKSRQEDFIRTRDGQIVPLNAGDYDGVIARVAAEDRVFADTISAKQAQVKQLKIEQKAKNSNKKAIKNEINKLNKEIKATNKQKQKPRKCGYKDPIAQTFKVDEETGWFITSVEVFFQKKDRVLPVSCQIRTVVAGSPTSTILPFAEKTLEPKNINVSDDASVPTKFTFDSPIYLNNDTEYAIVLQTDSSDYFAWISRMSEVDISTRNLPESQQVIVSQQPYLGSLFKSQNGETWDASQLEDLKFNLYIAEFNIDGGTFACYNPKLDVGNNQIVTLRKDPITSISRTNTIILNNNITTPIAPGFTITQLNNLNSSGKLISTKGAIGIGSTLALTINNVGSGLTPSTGSFTYNNVNLVSLSGVGTGAVAQVTVTNGNLGVATVTNGGSGYSVGDVVTVKLGQLSENIRYNVGIVSAFNTLELNDVQGQFDLSNEIVYLNVGAATTFQYTGAAPIPSNIITTPLADGLHFKVSHKNHGMHSIANKVIIDNLVSNLNPNILQETYTSTATTPIKVSAVGIFTSFENVPVSANNPGYVQIDEEIIRYTGVNQSVSPPTLTGITRGIDSSLISQHDVNDLVYKYELNGVSLRRINTTHNLSSANPLLKVGLDDYYLRIDTSSTGKGVVRDGTIANGFPILRFNSTSNVGGVNALASQNIQYEVITPNIGYITPSETSVSCRIRTVSATSASGVEASFIDQGFEEINLNQINYLETPRLVASNVNESAYLPNLPNNKSLWVEFILQSDNENVSPVIDLERLSMILTSNRIDAPVSDFITDERVNNPYGDPHAAVYVSKKVQLENPATSLDVRFSAQRQQDSDIRVMYKLFRPDSPDEAQPYILFPGYTGNEDGTSVLDVGSSNDLDEVLDYSYKVDNLAAFTGFMIKIIMAGKNQAKPPQIKDLSVIALA